MNPINQPELPLPAQPGSIDWTQGIDCRYGQLKGVIEAAGRAGYQATRMQVIRLGYRVEFVRDAALHHLEAGRPAQANGEAGKASLETV